MNIQDNNKHTAVHLVAAHQSEDHAVASAFPEFIKYACQSKFDFSLLDDRGQSVLHIAAFRGLHTSVQTILDLAKEYKISIDLNQLSTSGSTPFFYSINSLNYDQAHSLISAGADLTKKGVSDRDPLQEVNKYILHCEQKLIELGPTGDLDLTIKQAEYQQQQLNIFQNHISKLKEIQKIILKQKDEMIKSSVWQSAVRIVTAFSKGSSLKL